MPLWLWVADFLAACVGLLLLLVISVGIRRRWLLRGGGAFEMSVNRSREARSAQGWMIGIAVYRDAEVEWYRTFSLMMRPKFRFPRGRVLVVGRRHPQGTEKHALHDGHLIVETENPTAVQQLAMSENSLTGLLSWLESSPPGRGLRTTI